MNGHSLSVVVCHYNHGAYVEEALDAVLSQSFPPAEVIVSDDGSTDGSIEVIRRIAARHKMIRLVEHRINRGVVKTANDAVALASGDYVYFAAADDRVEPGFFAQCMELLQRYPQAGLCQVEVRTSDGRTIRSHLSAEPRYLSATEGEHKFACIGAFTASQSNSIVKRSAHNQAGGLIEELKWYCDVFAAMVVGIRHGVCFVPQPLVRIRIASRSSYSAAGRQRSAERREVFKHLLEVLSRPAFRDVKEWIRRTSVWPMAYPEMVPALASDRRFHGFLSLRLIARLLLHGARETLSGAAPLTTKRVYGCFRNSYRWARLST